MKTLRPLLSPVIAVVLALSASFSAPFNSSAAPPQPNPLAGNYCNNQIQMSISSKGRISGTTSNGGDVSGSVTVDGLIELKFTSSSRTSGNSTPGNGATRYTSTAAGLATLDDDGNLVLLLVFDAGNEGILVIPSCL